MLPTQKKAFPGGKLLIILFIAAAVFLMAGGCILLTLKQHTLGAVFCIGLGAFCMLFFGIGLFEVTHPGNRFGAALLIGLCVSFCGCLVFGVFASMVSTVLIKPFMDMEHYLQVWQDPVSVTATVTKHRSYDDDGDKDYISCITYIYDGVTYMDREYENRDKKEDLTGIGETVTVAISPKDPSRQISDLKTNSRLAPFGICILFLGLTALYTQPQKLLLSKSDAPDTQTICRDIKIKVRSRILRPFFLLCAIGYGFLYGRYSLLFGIVPAIIAAAAAAGWLFCLFTTIRDHRRAERGDYRLHRDVLVEKKVLSDSDGTTYVLHYRNSERIWKTTTTEKNFQQLALGHTVVAVYLPGKKKPIVHY